MCFVEFLGYTCGHTGLPVLRPCPMTTGLYSNPSCPQPAMRPQLEGMYCAACTRIMHGRWVDIIENEHRWEHEHGTCSCPVHFPGMMEPRMIGAPRRSSDSTTAASTGGTSIHNTRPAIAFGSNSGEGLAQNMAQLALSNTAPGSASTLTTGHNSNNGENTTNNNSTGNPRNKNKGKNNKKGGKNGRRGGQNNGNGSNNNGNNNNNNNSSSSSQRNTNPNNSGSTYQQPHQAQSQQEQREMYPPFDEVRDENGQVRYTVRLPSYYGVEWSWDHAELHKEGRCDCGVRFDQYSSAFKPQEPNPFDTTSGTSAAVAEAGPSGSGNNNSSSSNQGASTAAGFQRTPSAYSHRAGENETTFRNPWDSSSRRGGQGGTQATYGQPSIGTSAYPTPEMPAAPAPTPAEGFATTAPLLPAFPSTSSGPFQSTPHNDDSSFREQQREYVPPPHPPADHYTRPARWSCNSARESGYSVGTFGRAPSNATGSGSAADSSAATYSSFMSPTASPYVPTPGNNNNNSSRSTGTNPNVNVGPSPSHNSYGSGSGGNAALGTSNSSVNRFNTSSASPSSSQQRPVDMNTWWTSPASLGVPRVGLPLGQGPEGGDASGVSRTPAPPNQLVLYDVAANSYHASVAAARSPGGARPRLRGGNPGAWGQGEEGGSEQELSLLPLSGFPIGAGPEGDSHAGPFEQCALYQEIQVLRAEEMQNETSSDVGYDGEYGRPNYNMGTAADAETALDNRLENTRELEARRCSSVAF